MKDSLWNEIARRIEDKARARRPGPDLMTMPAKDARAMGAWLPETFADDDIVTYRRQANGSYDLEGGGIDENI